MRPTLRGVTAVLVLGAAIAMAWGHGPRALNAVVVPLVIALLAGVATVARVDRPAIRRAAVAEGFVGERRTVEVEIETGGAVSATVRDAVGDGLSAAAVDATGATETDGGRAAVAETTLEGEDRFGYEVRLEERGNRRVGPVTVTVTDVLGLVERRFSYEETTSVLVYPPVRDLWGSPGPDLHAFVEEERADREEFDHLREYQRGDSLRDVHWKSAAKRPDDDLVVTEYVDDEETGSATVAAECSPGRADDLATAVASVATHLLEAGVDVGVALPDAERPPGAGRDHHRDLLGLFATLEAGELEERRRRDADVLVRADAEGTRVVVDGRAIPFERFTGSRTGRTANGDRRTARGGSGRNGSKPESASGTGSEVSS